ncbi:MAG TPA: alpha/beta hydrolase [Candidatus Limnocylindrales bacterium]
MGDEPRNDPVVIALSNLVAGGVTRGGLARDHGRQLRWIEGGMVRSPGKPTVILVAGAGEMGLDWAPILPALAEKVHVVAYDRAGLGASDRATRLTLDAQVDDLVALVDAFGADGSPVVLVGHSWGGLLVQLAAFARPDRVAGLVLVDPFHEETTAKVPWTLRAMSSVLLNLIVVLQAVGLFRSIARRKGREYGRRLTDDPRIQAMFIDAYEACYPTMGQVAMIRAEGRLADSCTEQAKAARAAATIPDIPMRVLTATRGLPPALLTHTREFGAQTAAGFPRGEHTVVPDSSHYIHWDQPDAVMTAIDSVLEDIAPDKNVPDKKAPDTERPQ